MKKLAFRILVVDDFEPWRRLASRALQEKQELLVVGEASDGSEAVRKAQELQPDLILLDIGLPTVNGIEAARRILQYAPEMKILFVSEQRDSDIVEEALRTGAGGYVVKSKAASELLPAVEAVLRGKQFVSASLTGHENEHIKPLRRQQVDHHEIKFHADHSALADDFAQFTEAALNNGDAVVIIATESLRTSIFQRLRRDGMDIGAAAERYLPLEIFDPLSRFTVGEAVKTARQGGLHIAVGWECTPTLWAQGEADTAIQWERFLRELAQTGDTDVRCGCALGMHHRDHERSIIEQICAEHSG